MLLSSSTLCHVISSAFRPYVKFCASDFVSYKIMGASAVPVIVFTVFWGIVGIVLPFVVPKGPNRGVLQVILIITAASCYLFWLCCYMSQMNPLIGPKLNARTLMMMAREWGNPITS